LLFIAVLWLLLPGAECAEALDMNRTVPIHCRGRFDTSSSGMFNLAYEWTRHSKLHDWSYTTIGRECALVSYTTQIHLKHMFQQLIPSRALHVKITKHVCVRGRQLFETINLTELLLIERMEIKIRAELDHATDSLLMHAYSDVAVPWLLKTGVPDIRDRALPADVARQAEPLKCTHMSGGRSQGQALPSWRGLGTRYEMQGV
jgi:hypothetical protein